jgi:hypothetical protein
MGQPLNHFMSLPLAARKRPRGRPAPGIDASVVRDVAAFHQSQPQAGAGRLDLVRTRRDRPAQLQRRARDVVGRTGVQLELSRNDDGSMVPEYCRDDGDDEDGNDDGESDEIGAGVTVVYRAAEGLFWELGWWPDVSLSHPSALEIFQIVLDVLAETVGISIGTLRVRDNLHRLQGVADALRLLGHISIDGGGARGDGQANGDIELPPHGGSNRVSTFQHPITGDPIRIVVYT